MTVSKGRNKIKEFNLYVKQIKKVKNEYVVVFECDNSKTIIHKFSEDQIVKYRITLNKKFVWNELDNIIKNSNIDKWYFKALNYIFKKIRSEKEVWYFLDKSNLDYDSKKVIIDRLLENKYLDNERFVRVFLENAFSKCLGINYVIHTLESLGINSELINKYIDSYNELDLLDDLIKQYQKIELTLISLPIPKQKLILTKKMALKGISTTTIQEVLKYIEFSEDITNTFIKDLNKVKRQTTDEYKIIQKLLRLGYTYDYIKRHLNV